MGFKESIIGGMSKVKFKAIDHAPELLMGGGTIGFIFTCISAGRAVLRFQEDLKAHNERLEKLDHIRIAQAEGTATDEEKEIDIKTYRLSTYFETGKRALITFGPTIALGVLSVSSFCMATGIMKKRYGKLAGAFATLLADQKHLENSIKEKYGEEELLDLKGLSNAKAVIDATVDEETGEVVEEKITHPEAHSMFSRFFDESNDNWEKSAESNRFFLQGKERWFNHKLAVQGHLFLNEVLTGLGFEETQAGQIFGWIYDKEDGTTGCVDFGIFRTDSPAKRNFVNGVERSILLEFNCDDKPILSRTGFAKV